MTSRTSPLDLETLFEQAVALAPDERPAFITKACTGHVQAERELTALVEAWACEDEAFILDRPVSRIAVDGLEPLGPGARVGRYALRERIGDGGMGVVYRAEQIEGVQRTVACKIIKLGMESQSVVDRFQIERQSLALFDHPNITRVLDAGTTPDGQPFFIMEFFDGQDITRYAAEQELDLDARLELFVTVCGAVQHAHQKGIVHRDLKPSNVLVATVDGRPTPKVIDFGIAKALDVTLPGMAYQTRMEAVLGTPRYMSPEQLGVGEQDVDTRTDIFSLGALLFELVTASTPLSFERDDPVHLAERAKNYEAPLPSSRIDLEVDQPSPVSGITRRGLMRRLQEGLDWVIVKAIAARREDRYATAAELARDVQRVLDGDPVEASTQGRWYRVRTLARKHRRGVLVASGVALVLAAATAICTVFAVNTWNAKEELANAHADLKASHGELQDAQRKLWNTSNRERYDTAHRIAMTKTFATINDAVDAKRPELLKDFVGKKLADGTVIEDTELFGGVFCYEPRDLLDLQHKSLVEPALARIQDSLDRQDAADEHMWIDFVDVEPAAGHTHEHDHTHLTEAEACPPDCVGCAIGEIMEGQAKKEARLARPHFFKTLVAEYRRAFGNADVRVADALELLGAALLEQQAYKEARTALEEAQTLRARGECGDLPKGLTFKGPDPADGLRLLQLARQAGR